MVHRYVQNVAGGLNQILNGLGRMIKATDGFSTLTGVKIAAPVFSTGGRNRAKPGKPGLRVCARTDEPPKFNNRKEETMKTIRAICPNEHTTQQYAALTGPNKGIWQCQSCQGAFTRPQLNSESLRMIVDQRFRSATEIAGGVTGLARLIARQPGYKHGRVMMIQKCKDGGYRLYALIDGAWMDASLDSIR